MFGTVNECGLWEEQRNFELYRFLRRQVSLKSSKQDLVTGQSCQPNALKIRKFFFFFIARRQASLPATTTTAKF
ncbi:hypothetical protein CEXT_691831 [Caerostris extrusa]|uniref:Uncharacterized protein n=1 Tax=Caerostris extrusa TaxID=172846 RepID=A0AAV4VHA6_CAEEX|nr:hypothetical protein CEXT_691831 [Caerostris extrusa]